MDRHLYDDYGGIRIKNIIDFLLDI
jgi:hypothetical protein